MKLNHTSYVHVTIRQLCVQLEVLSGMKLITNLSDDFYEIRLINSYGYIIIDYCNNACFTLSHHLSNKEFETIKDIMLYCNWLLIGDKYKNV